jgi:hypothetical protein
VGGGVGEGFRGNATEEMRRRVADVSVWIRQHLPNVGRGGESVGVEMFQRANCVNPGEAVGVGEAGGQGRHNAAGVVVQVAEGFCGVSGEVGVSAAKTLDERGYSGECVGAHVAKKLSGNPVLVIGDEFEEIWDALGSGGLEAKAGPEACGESWPAWCGCAACQLSQFCECVRCLRGDEAEGLRSADPEGLLVVEPYCAGDGHGSCPCWPERQPDLVYCAEEFPLRGGFVVLNPFGEVRESRRPDAGDGGLGRGVALGPGGLSEENHPLAEGFAVVRRLARPKEECGCREEGAATDEHERLCALLHRAEYGTGGGR